MCLDLPVLLSPGSGERELEDKRRGSVWPWDHQYGLPECLPRPGRLQLFSTPLLSSLTCEIGFSLPYGTLVTHKEISNR